MPELATTHRRASSRGARTANNVPTRTPQEHPNDVFENWAAAMQDRASDHNAGPAQPRFSPGLDHAAARVVTAFFAAARKHEVVAAATACVTRLSKRVSCPRNNPRSHSRRPMSHLLELGRAEEALRWLLG